MIVYTVRAEMNPGMEELEGDCFDEFTSHVEGVLRGLIGRDSVHMPYNPLSREITIALDLWADSAPDAMRKYDDRIVRVFGILGEKQPKMLRYDITLGEQS